MTEDVDKQKIGAIAFYPTEVYCALASLRDGHFYGPIEWTTNPISTRSPDDAFTKAIAFFLRHNAKLDGLALSFYGVVKGQNFCGSTQENWEEDFDIWKRFIHFKGSDILKEVAVTGDQNDEKKSRVWFHHDAALASIGEYIWGAGKNLQNEEIPHDQKNLAYFKVRDGVGSGIILAGRLWEGAIQPEMGHIPVRRAKGDDYPGICPKHADCIEGLASRAAMIDRLASYPASDKVESLQSLDKKESHEIWKFEAYYLAELAAISNLVVAPRKIIFEGEIIRNHLLEKIRACFIETLNDYPKAQIGSDTDQNLLVQGHFYGHEATLLGGLELARRKANAIKPQEEGTKRYRAISENETSRLLYRKSAEFDKSIERMKVRRLNRPTITPGQSDIITTVQKPEKKWVFGLSITETIEWAIASATDGILDDQSYETGLLCDIPFGLMPIDDADPIYLQEALREGLLKLYRSRKEFFDQEKIGGIGVSSIGVVDRNKFRLENISRKPWLPPQTGKPVVDFGELFKLSDEYGHLMFPEETSNNRMIVQNDAPARCLTEYLYGFSEHQRPDGLLYLMVGEGVNGAAVSKGNLLHMLEHPELGHSFPMLHKDDLNIEFNEMTGCPSHVTCFEGVASSARFRRQYGRDIWEFDYEHSAWDLEAYYLSQLVMNGVLTFAPEMVLLGGQVLQGPKGISLLEKIRREFAKRNNGYLPRHNSSRDIDRLIRRAQFGDRIKPLSALTMGCLAAFSVNKFGKEMTVQELSIRSALRAERKWRK